MDQNIIVLVIAHNEGKNIEKCLDSLVNQTLKPSKIIVVVHNSKDQTYHIAHKFAQLHPETCIKIIPYICAPEGVVYARLKALQYIEDEEYVLCIDGDSFAQTNWAGKMLTNVYIIPYMLPDILVGSYVKFKGPFFFCLFLNIINKMLTSIYKKNPIDYIWGPSFGFPPRDKKEIVKCLRKSIELKEKLQLGNIPEDYILAKYMVKIKKGRIRVINSTFVTTHTKEKTFQQMLNRLRNNLSTKFKIDEYVKKEKNST